MASPTLGGKWEGLLFLLGAFCGNELSRAAGGILAAANGSGKVNHLLLRSEWLDCFFSSVFPEG